MGLSYCLFSRYAYNSTTCKGSRHPKAQERAILYCRSPRHSYGYTCGHSKLTIIPIYNKHTNLFPHDLICQKKNSCSQSYFWGKTGREGQRYYLERLGLLGNHPFRTRSRWWNSSPIDQNDDALHTASSVDHNNCRIIRLAASVTTPTNINTHQHLTPK